MNKKISSIIVDDEFSNRQVLRNLLARYCPDVEVVDEASSAEEGYEKIQALSPDLVFLDVKMPQKSGFDMLRMFEQISFRIIFVTAHDDFAFQAFEFSAMDYILKPIDYTKLIRAVDKVSASINQGLKSDVIHFVRSLDEENRFFKSLSFHTKDKVSLVNIDTICFVKADRNYSEVHTSSGTKFSSPKTLSEYEAVLSSFPNFIRVNKSYIVNIEYLKEYTKGIVCMLYIENCPEEIEVSRRKKSQILQYLKNGS